MIDTINTRNVNKKERSSIKRKTLHLLISLMAILVLSQEGLSLQALNELNVNYMLSGYCYAGSRIKDTQTLGGFGTSENLPKGIEPRMNLEQGKVYLLVKPDEEIAFNEKYKGVKLLLVNSTNDQVGFSAQDSRLYIMQEALDKHGEWKPIEYLPSSWCGNSYHQIFLGASEFWEFAAARYTGKIKTKLRFRLNHEKQVIYSNEFEGSVNEGQFTIKQGHKPTSIMDPYNN